MLDAKTIILEYVCPGMGCLMANLMFAAPYQDAQKAVQRGDLGSLNPTPWAFMLGNCFGWVTYGILTRNFWIYFANAPGFLLSIWLNLGAAKLLYQRHYATQMRASFVNYLKKTDKRMLDTSTSTTTTDVGGVSTMTLQQQQETTIPTTLSSTVTDFCQIVWDVTSQTTPAPVRHETLVLIISTIWMALATFLTFGDNVAMSTKEFTIGIVVNLNLVFFYGAPLSTIYTVLSSSSSASIHIPTMMTNTMNGTFWTAYGFAVNDYFVYVPNGLGALLGAVQMVLCVLYPRATTTNANANAKDNDNNNDDDEYLRIDVEQPQQKGRTGKENDNVAAAVSGTAADSKEEEREPPMSDEEERNSTSTTTNSTIKEE